MESNPGDCPAVADESVQQGEYLAAATASTAIGISVSASRRAAAATAIAHAAVVVVGRPAFDLSTAATHKWRHALVIS